MYAWIKLGSISAALSCLVCVPPLRGKSAGSFPEQWLVIEPRIKLSKVIPVWLGEALRIPFTCRSSQLKLSSGESSSVCSFEETLFSTSVSSLLIRESSILEPFEGGLTSGVFKYSLAAVVSKRSLVTLKQRLYDSVCGSFLIFVWRNLHDIFRDITIENKLRIEISDLFVQKPGEVETWDYSCGHFKKRSYSLAYLSVHFHSSKPKSEKSVSNSRYTSVHVSVCLVGDFTAWLVQGLDLARVVSDPTGSEIFTFSDG